MNSNKNTKRKMLGFYLVEILVVVIIVAILAIMLLPNYKTYVEQAQAAASMQQASAVRIAVEACIEKHGGDPTGCDSGTNGIPASTYQTSP